MKKLFICFVIFLMPFLIISELSAAAFKSASMNGATGLISTPTAKTGWEDSFLGLDLGVRYVGDSDQDSSKIGTATLQLFNKWELGGAYDMQGDKRGNDLLVHTKINFYNAGSSAIAIGGNYQNIKYFSEDSTHTFQQVYLATTYGGSFFGMPAETTLVFGKTFGKDAEKKNYDFSMGFDLDLFPSIFKGYIHSISDFANYSYSMNPTGANSASRGCFNTGARISVFKDSRKFKFNIDTIFTDVLDRNRAFSMGVCGGLAF